MGLVKDISEKFEYEMLLGISGSPKIKIKQTSNFSWIVIGPVVGDMFIQS
jgi:hypothetical protein